MITKIKNDMKETLKAGEKLRLSTIRILISAINNERIEKKAELSNEEVVTVVQREVKIRRNAIEEYKKGARDDLVQQALQEIAMLEVYLPQQLSDEELEAMIKQAMAEVNVTSPKEMGKLMGKLMPLIKGKADGTRVQAMVKQLLDQ